MGFRDFPYTNYHDLNADWLLETVKKDAESNAQLKATTDALQKRVETDLSSQNTKINDLQRTTTAKLNAQDAKIAENNASEVQLINNWGTNLNNKLNEDAQQISENMTNLIDQWGEQIPVEVANKMENYKNDGTFDNLIIDILMSLEYVNTFTNKTLKIAYYYTSTSNKFKTQQRNDFTNKLKNALLSGAGNTISGGPLVSSNIEQIKDYISDGANKDVVVITEDVSMSFIENVMTNAPKTNKYHIIPLPSKNSNEIFWNYMIEKYSIVFNYHYVDTTTLLFNLNMYNDNSTIKTDFIDFAPVILSNIIATYRNVTCANFDLIRKNCNFATETYGLYSNGGTPFKGDIKITKDGAYLLLTNLNEFSPTKLMSINTKSYGNSDIYNFIPGTNIYYSNTSNITAIVGSVVKTGTTQNSLKILSFNNSTFSVPGTDNPTIFIPFNI